MMIRLIGPGRTGKSTAGAVLARLLALPFLDLDRSFVEEHGDIDRFIGSQGYQAYARANVEVYRSIVRDKHDGVFALSSGFMTYPPAIHQPYAEIRRDIERSITTFVLLHGEWKVALNLCATAAFVALWRDRQDVPSVCAPVGATATMEPTSTIAGAPNTEGT